jgi:hypothetical protein
VGSINQLMNCRVLLQEWPHLIILASCVMQREGVQAAAEAFKLCPNKLDVQFLGQSASRGHNQVQIVSVEVTGRGVGHVARHRSWSGV